jgi:hypothetical protein
MLQACEAVGRTDRPKAVSTQIGVEDLGDLGFVFDDQDEGVVHGRSEPGVYGDCAKPAARVLQGSGA